jgi:hypothetical protein
VNRFIIQVYCRILYLILLTWVWIIGGDTEDELTCHSGDWVYQNLFYCRSLFRPRIRLIQHGLHELRAVYRIFYLSYLLRFYIYWTVLFSGLGQINLLFIRNFWDIILILINTLVAYYPALIMILISEEPWIFFFFFSFLFFS